MTHLWIIALGYHAHCAPYKIIQKPSITLDSYYKINSLASQILPTAEQYLHRLFKDPLFAQNSRHVPLTILHIWKSMGLLEISRVTWQLWNWWFGSVQPVRKSSLTLCRIYKMVYGLEWLTVYVLTKGLFWCLFPKLRNNKGKKHQNNTWVSA